MKNLILLIFIASFFIQCESENLLPADCSIPATVRDLRGFDGCGFVLELANGKRIEPQMVFRCGTMSIAKEATEDPLIGFEFYDGQKVHISYEETNRPSICMVGPTVRITCIEEVQPAPEE